MRTLIEERAASCAEYIIENQCTVRQAAKKFGVSKSTIHKDVAHRLKYIDNALYNQVKCVLDKNKLERHVRGGQATKNKYLQYAAVKKG